MSSRKQKLLNLKQRVNVVNEPDEGVSCRPKQARALAVGNTQEKGTTDHSTKITNSWDDGTSSGNDIPESVKSVNHEINSKTLVFLYTGQKHSISSNRLLQDLAIFCHVQCRGIVSVGAPDAVEDWQKHVISICQFALHGSRIVSHLSGSHREWQTAC